MSTSNWAAVRCLGLIGKLIISRFACLVVATTSPAAEPLVIAHRGASGYLPEHTLEAKALAYGMGADYLEQDLVLSKDNHPIVLHDIHLDSVTDVASKFRGRARQDGRYYALDFTLREIKTLRVHERIHHEDGQVVFRNRFPLHKSRFEIPTLAEEIELIQGLNQSTGRNVGIYPEIKQPAWHRRQHYDISRVVLETLRRYGYETASDSVYLQCFDATELKRLRGEFKTQLRLVQLLAGDMWTKADTDAGSLQTRIAEISQYADGIGPALSHIFTGKKDGVAQFTPLIDLAHRHGLQVHPYTFRADALPTDVQTLEELLRMFRGAGVDGVFSDFPDRCVRFFRKQPRND